MPNDYQAAREGVAFIDVSDRGKIEVAGPDARTFLHNLCTQDVKNLPVGESREAFLTTNKARIVAHVWITHRQDNILLLDMARGLAAKTLEHLNRFLISEQAELRDCTEEFALVRVIGPKSANLISTLGRTPTRLHSLAGLDGFDLLCPTAERISAQALETAGAIRLDRMTYDTLCIESGLPEYGIDIDENRLAMEVNRPQAISYNKGCYLGQETIVMARDRGQVNRLLMGLTVADNDAAPLPPGAKALRGNDEVGQVTSSVFSPRLGRVIALAYLRRGAWDAGTDVVVDGRPAQVSALPIA